MPQVKFDRIVSCSSEHPAYPAKNLLLGRDYSRKWKCKEPGEERISVIIQLTQQYVITGIDIGNECAAFVEVLVSRTSTPDDFQVLLVMSSFMTPMDARSETNKNRVRMFSQKELSDSVRQEKWDRIKVVCTQPFNKHLQYGLSFIVLHTSEPKSESSLNPSTPAKKTIGRFALKDDDNDNDISVGSFFSRRKDLQVSPPRPAPATGAAAVRDASSPANFSDLKGSTKRKGSDDLNDSQKKKRGIPKKDMNSTLDASASTSASVDSIPKTKRNGGTPKTDEKSQKNREKNDDRGLKTLPSPDRSKIKDNAKLHKHSSDDDQDHANAAPGSSRENQSSLKNVTYKPFNKLFEGVEIVISGYENPGRGDVRDKALAMGARYNGNWSRSSTHLICAFPNTPKFNEVQGRGVIVIRDWVDDCFRERKKLSWRKYATVVKERQDVHDDPEVWELVPDKDVNNAPQMRRNNLAVQDTRLGSDSEDSEDEIEKIRAKQKLKKTKLENELKVEAKEKDAKKDSKNKKSEVYDGSTDVDSEEEAKNRLTEWSERQKKVTKDNLPPLPDFFKKKTFYVSQDLSETDRQSVCRYITAFGGEILHVQDKSVQYIISTKGCKLPEVGH